MKCPLCGYEFQEEEGRAACTGCPLVAGCHMIKGPNCDYDIPEEPKLIKLFRAWREKRHDRTR